MPILTSPFPTAHDTIGPSTLSSPRQIPSSPPSPQSRPRSPQNGPSDAPGVNNQLTAKSSSEVAALDLDKRLSEYMVNWNKFPGASKDAAVDVFEDDDENQDLEVGGPEDFTMNLDKYLEETTFRNEGVRDRNENGLGQEEPEEGEDEDDHDDEEEDDEEERVLPEYSPSPSPRPRHRHNPEEAEESEFGPPVDISTPSHLMWRRNYGSGKEETRLENIEESLNGSPAKTESPAKSDRSNGMEESRTFTTVLREIEDLHEQRRERDEKIRENEKQIASSRVEIDRLRAELLRKDDLLSEANGRLEEQELLRQQLKSMEKQAGEQASGSEKHAAQIQSLQDELEKAHQHIKSRDEALEESSAKLRELTAVNEMLARQKDTEIDDLKGQINEKELQIIDADEELAEVQRQYDILKDRIESLEARSIPLKEKTLSLESELAQSKDEHASLKQSLINITADLPIDIEGKNCSEIINILHQHIKETKKRPHLDHEEQETQQREKELQDKLDRIESALRQSVADKEVAATELERSKNLLAETRKLVITVEEENTRLTTRTQELSLSLNQTREDMENLKEQHRRELASLHNKTGSEATRLHDSNIDKTHQALKEAHRLEIQNLREINNSAINELRASYNGTIQHLRNMHSKAERRATDLQNQLLDMQSTTNAQSREIQDLRSEIQQLRNTLSLKEEAAADLDKVIAKSIEKREREWERRMELVLRERDQMGKALMWTWGEIEVGKTSAESSKNKRRHESGSATATANDTGNANANANAATMTTVARPVSGERAVGGQPRQGYKYKYIVRS